MVRVLYFIIMFGLIGCNTSTNLTYLASLPYELEEASGITTIRGSDLFWMHNDSGNESVLYGIDSSGNIQRKIIVNAKNIDWEDMTSDHEGNIYIGDFGNNTHSRKNLVILKINKQDVFNEDSVSVEKIAFNYPDQYTFPPENGQYFFDAESIFYANNYVYILTKSAVKNQYGKTKLYKVPAKKGMYEAEFISEFNAGTTSDCKITSASISSDQTKVALLTHNKVFIFSNYSSEDFFQGNMKTVNLKHTSQKEAITFKNDTTVYITDERSGNTGGNLYELICSEK